MSIAEQVYMEALKQSQELNYSIEIALADRTAQVLFELDCVAIDVGHRNALTSSVFKNRFLSHVDNFFNKRTIT